jgi:hypothetical protein
VRGLLYVYIILCISSSEQIPGSGKIRICIHTATYEFKDGRSSTTKKIDGSPYDRLDGLIPQQFLRHVKYKRDMLELHSNKCNEVN